MSQAELDDDLRRAASEMNRAQRRAAGERGPKRTGDAPTAELAACPTPEAHGNPFRYCACGWIEPDAPAVASATGDGLVQIGYLHSHTVSYSWHESFTRMIAWDAGHEGRLVETAGPIAIRCDTASIPESRNLLAQMFLDTPHEWLMMTDTDMGFAPDSVDRLVASADPVSRPVVGGLCFAAREVAPDGFGGRRIVAIPTLFDFRTDAGSGVLGFANRLEYVPGELAQVAGTGGAFLLIHRSVIEAVRAEHGDHWFSQVRLDDGRQISEDLSFCARAGRLGFPIYVDTAVKTTHHKSVFIGEDDYHMNGAPTGG